MRHILITLLLFSLCQLGAQKDLWTVDVSKDGFMNQLDDGKILLKDQKEISLINNLTGKVEWKNTVATDKDPIFLNGVPIMYFEGKSFAVVDASSGEVIAESSVKTTVMNTHYFWDEGRIIMELNRDKSLEILSIDLNNLDQSWTTKVGKVQKMLMGLAARSTKNAPSIANDGTCILVDKKFISLLSDKGEIKSRIEFDKDIKKQGYNKSKDVLYVLEDKKKLHFIDVKTANIVFTKECKEKNLDLEVLGDGQSIAIIQKDELHIMNATSGDAMGMHKSKDKIQAVYNDLETSKYLILSKKQLKEIDILTADVLNEKTMDTDFVKMYELNDELFVTGRSRLNQVNINDLSVKYAKSAGTLSPQNIINLDSGRAFLHQNIDKFYLTVVDDSGQKVWSKEMNTSVAPSVDIINDGMLIIDSEEARYLSIKEGKPLWKSSLKTGPSFSFVVNLDTDNIVMFSDKRLYFFDTSTGGLKRTKDSFKFKDFDYDTQSPQLLLTDNKVFLKGSNSVFIVNDNGITEYAKNYKKSDNTSGLLKLANLVATAAVVGSGNGEEVVSVYDGNGSQMHKGGMVDDMNSNWEYSDDLADERRARQNMSSSGFPYVFTKQESGDRGLIFLNPATGDEKFSITMKEKEPNYIIDEIDGIVFYLNKSELKAIDIK